jgi:hypothetical protein
MPLALSASTVTEALDRADARHWTRQPPHSDRARVNFLLRQVNGDHQDLAARLGTTPDTITQVLTGQRPAADDPLHRTLEREVLARWQPRVRQRAHDAILSNHGLMMVSFRAFFGFASAAGSSDDPRLRYLTLGLAERYPEKLFTARHRAAPESELHNILSDALAASYFHRNNPGVAEKVSLQQIDFLEFSY